MLKSIKIENFKSFGQGRTVRLAPITLIYGPNSSGKSSLIQALLLLRQTLTEQGLRGRNDLLTNGSFAQLGSFTSLLHRHDPARKLKLGFEFATLPERSRVFTPMNFDPCRALTLSYSATSLTPQEFLPFLSALDFELIGSAGQPISFGLERMGAATMAALLAKAASSPDDEIEEAEARERESVRRPERDDDFKFTPDSDLTGLYQAAEISGREMRLRREPEANPTIGQVPITEPSAAALEALRAYRFRAEAIGPLWREYIPSNPRSASRPSYRGSKEGQTSGGLRSLLRGFDIRLRQTIGSLTYLGPLRTHPERLYALQGLSEGSVGSQGEQAVQILYHDRVSSRPGRAMIDQLNIYCEQFDIPYRFAVDSIRNEITGDFVVLSLTDRRTGVKVAPTDVGFGIGQILPILVEGMVSQKQEHFPRIVCVEQPEIHLHPRLQAAMADFFIDTAFLLETPSADDRRPRHGVQWILETHSETLVLRLQRRIREGKLSPQDVSVLYVDPRGKQGSVIEELRLDEDGEFIDEWPDGFFAEGFNEMFGGR